MSKKKESVIDSGVLSGWSSNARRKSDARVSYRSLYPRAKTRWMGHGPSPGKEPRVGLGLK